MHYMKSEVYSWRLPMQLKSELEREARKRKVSMASMIETAVRDWLKNSRDPNEEAEQRRLHKELEKSIGCFSSGRRDLSTRASELAREAIWEHHQREKERNRKHAPQRTD